LLYPEVNHNNKLFFVYLPENQGNLNICQQRGADDEEGYKNSSVFIMPGALYHGAGQFYAHTGTT
jgi:hypothetical protein